MRWSTLFIPTLREPQAHRLLERAGYIRQTAPGHFSYLPLAQRSLRKIEQIVRAEMNTIGAQEIHLPLLAGTSAEEIVAAIAKSELRSHKQLPQFWYQIQAAAVDSFVFGADTSGLAAAHHRVCTHCSLQCEIIDTGLVIYSETGEEPIVRCNQCNYAGHLDLAVSKASGPPPDPEGDFAPEEFSTPGLKTIASIAEFTALPESSQMKSLVIVVDKVPVLAMLRGDHQLSLSKLEAALGAKDLRPAQSREIVELFGAAAGSLGPVAVKNTRVLADLALKGRRNMITGANRDDYHLRHVTPDEDFHPDYFDLRQAAAGEDCQRCSGTLTIARAIEIARTWANSYSLNLGRLLSVLAKSHSDNDGLRWPLALAPYQVVVTPVNYADPAQKVAADQIYGDCLRGGIDALLDDREERPGVKFKDADLIGVPYRVTLGKKLGEGYVELVDRRTRAIEEVGPESAASRLAALMLNVKSAAARS